MDSICAVIILVWSVIQHFSSSANHLQCQTWKALNLHPVQLSNLNLMFQIKDPKSFFFSFFFFLHIFRRLAGGPCHSLSVGMLSINPTVEAVEGISKPAQDPHTHTHTANFMAFKWLCHSFCVFSSSTAGLLRCMWGGRVCIASVRLPLLRSNSLHIFNLEILIVALLKTGSAHSCDD